MNNENQKSVRNTSGKAKFTTVNTIMPSLIVKLGLDRRMQEQALLSLWPSLVDPIYASRSMPLYIDEQNILVVAAENGSTAQELSFHKTKLLTQLQQIGIGLGLTIKGMRFDLKRFSQAQNSEKHAKALQNKPIEPVVPPDSELIAFTLTEVELKEIANLKKNLDAASSTEWSERIANLVEKKLRLKKWCIQNNMPTCEQCGEPLSPSCHQLNIKLCPYCKP